MFKQLILTELVSNRNILLISLALNLVLFIFFGLRDQDVYDFAGATMISFWVLLIVAASTAGHEKRNRLYMQLPVTPAQVFSAGWGFVLGWFSLQILAWVLFGITFSNEFAAAQVGQLVTTGLGAVIFIVIVSIGIDLGVFRPFYLQWIYILLMASLLGLAIIFDVSIGIQVTGEEGMQFLPISLLGSLQMQVQVSIAIVIALLAVDFLVYRYSDSYLN